MSEIIEIKNELMGVSSSDVERIGKHLETINQFVSTQLKEGINGDYGTVPGTKKKSLLKPGAEKLLKLFGLSVSVDCIDKTISPEENYAVFTYKAKIYHLRSGVLIAECEGMANSFEKKYKSSSCMDILNTLMKMAQKRAIVGATIIATAASDYFTQDEDEILSQQKNQVLENKFAKKEQNSNFGGYLITFGKHKGKKISDLKKEDLINYCEWLKNNNENPDGKMKELLDTARSYLREQKE